MLKTRDNIFTEFLVRNNRTTTDGFVSDTILKSWFYNAHIWAASSYKWPFTEGRIQTTFASAGGPGADEWYFEGFKSDSFRLVQVGGKRLQKLNFEDYQIFREEEPTGTDRVYSDFGRTVFINPNIDASGTVVAYGQLEPYVDVTDETCKTVFSDYEEEGNEAIVEKMSEYLKLKEMPGQQGLKVSEADIHKKKAQDTLDRLWKRISDEQFTYQTHSDRGGMFKEFDVLSGNEKEITEDRF